MKIKVLKRYRARIKASALDDATTISPPTDDAWVNDYSRNTNYGSDTRLVLGGTDYPKRIYVRFDLSSIPSGATVTLAKIRLYYYAHGTTRDDPAGLTVKAYRVLESWDESTITWNNQPSFSSTASGSGTIPTTVNTWMEISDLSSDVQNMLDGTYNNYGWVIKYPDESAVTNYATASFYSKEYDGYDPELYVEYTAVTYVTVSDSGTGTDYVETQAHLTIGDFGSGVDVSALRASIPVSDSGVGSETVLSPQVVEIMDSGSGVDNIPAIILGTISDSGSGIESIGLEASLKIDDSGIGSEYVTAAPPTTYVTDSGIGVDKVMVVKEQKRVKSAKRVRPAKRVRETRRVEEARD